MNLFINFLVFLNLIIIIIFILYLKLKGIIQEKILEKMLL